MELVHSTPGAYIPVPGCSAGILKGFVKKIESQKEFRIGEGVRKRTLTEISDPAKIPIQDLGVQNFQKCQKSWIFKVLCFARKLRCIVFG